MSSKQRRVAALWMRDHYNPVMRKPQRGAIVYGGGLSVPQWIADAEALGYHATLTPECVVLR
jgi:hypothetical protein